MTTGRTLKSSDAENGGGTYSTGANDAVEGSDSGDDAVEESDSGDDAVEESDSGDDAVEGSDSGNDIGKVGDAVEGSDSGDDSDSRLLGGAPDDAGSQASDGSENMDAVHQSNHVKRNHHSGSRQHIRP